MNKTLIVKEWLEKGNTITDMKAVEICQSYRLSGIIYNLRNIYGMNIRDRWKENENTKVKYKEYYLEEE